MSNDKRNALVQAVLPRDPRVPSDIEKLTSASPLELTLRAWGGQARVDRAAADHIRGLIKSTLDEHRATRGNPSNAKA